MHEHRAHRTTTRRRVTISVVSVAMVALIATGVAILASPVAAAETKSSDVTAVAYGPLPEQLLDVHLPTHRDRPVPGDDLPAQRRLDRRVTARSSPTSSSQQVDRGSSRWCRSTTGW